MSADPGEKLLTVAGDMMEAETMHAALEAAGIASWLRYDSMGTTIFPGTVGAQATVEVWIREADATRATEVLGLSTTLEDDSWMKDEPWAHAEPDSSDPPE